MLKLYGLKTMLLIPMATLTWLCMSDCIAAESPFFQPLGHWTPVEVDQANKTVKVWGRQYQFGPEGVLMKQITSQGVNLLAAPGEVQVYVNGTNRILWGPSTVTFGEITKESVKVTTQTSATNANMSVTALIYIEFTGFTKITVDIANNSGFTLSNTVVNLPLAAWGERGVQHYNYTTTSTWHSHGSSDVGGEGWDATGLASSHSVFDEKKGISWFSNAEINSHLLKTGGTLHFAINAGPSSHMDVYSLAFPAKPKAPGYADYDYRWAFTTSYYDDVTLKSLYNLGYRALVLGENLVSTVVFDPAKAKDFVNRAHAIGMKVLFDVWWWEINCPDVPSGSPPNGCAAIGKNVYSSEDRIRPWITEYNLDGFYLDECWPASPHYFQPALTENNDLIDYYANLKDLYANMHTAGKGLDRISLINHNSGGNYMPAHDLWFDMSYKGEDWGEYQKAPTNGTLDDLLQIIWMELTQYPSNVPKDILSWPFGGRIGPADDVRGTWSICYMFGVTSPVHIEGYAAKVNYLLDNKATLDNFHGYWQTNTMGTATGTKIKVSGWSAQPGVKAIVSVNNWDEASAEQNVTLTVNATLAGIPAANMIVKDVETGTVLSAAGAGASLALTVKKRDYRLLEITNSAPVGVNADKSGVMKAFDKTYFFTQGRSWAFTGMVSGDNLRVYTMRGDLIKSLKESNQQIAWDGTDQNNRPLPVGIYMYEGWKKRGKIVIAN